MKKIISLILVVFFLVESTIVLSSCDELSRYKKELCSYDYRVKSKYSTVQSCFEALLTLNIMQVQNIEDINEEYFLDDHEKEILRAYNDEKFAELATRVLNNTTAKLEFSHSEIIETFSDHNGYLIGCVGEHYILSEYDSAFYSFLYFFRKDAKYKDDCVYYACKILYPKTFDQGIVDTFLSISGTSEAEKFRKTISYLSSSPEGITPYQDYIAIAEKQLAKENEKGW